MPFNETLANRIREALAHLPKVQEKFMFRGVCFMVNGKMCVCVGHDEMMCRIDPEKFDSLIERPGCRAMMRNGKALKGFVFVSEEGWKSKKDFTEWLNLCLEFNDRAKATKKRSTREKKKPIKKKTAKNKLKKVSKPKKKTKSKIKG
jgi:TfoX/Sxy family transcriptional regulator of competence genes